MRLHVQKNSVLERAPVTVKNVTYVIFCDDEGNPVGLAEQLGRDVISFTTRRQPEFAVVLKRLGFDATIPAVEVRR